MLPEVLGANFGSFLLIGCLGSFLQFLERAWPHSGNAVLSHQNQQSQPKVIDP